MARASTKHGRDEAMVSYFYYSFFISYALFSDMDSFFEIVLCFYC